MEKNILNEELRAIYRDIFRQEIKAFASDISFLGKLAASKMNAERISTDRRKWLINNGVLTSDSKNESGLDDRTVYSHMVSALYAGIYGLNFVDVTAHCLETIKKQKGLKPNCNLIDHISDIEIRNLSVAAHDCCRKIRQLKNSGQLRYASMNNFYEVADIAFNCGANARRNSVLNQNGDFRDKAPITSVSASNSLKNIVIAMQNGNFSSKNLYPKQISSNVDEHIEEYNDCLKKLKSTLAKYKITNPEQIKRILGLINCEFYKTDLCQKHNLDISTLFNAGERNFSENDLLANILKLQYADILISNLNRRETNIVYFDVIATALKAGDRARQECQLKFGTSPEYFSSFPQAYLNNVLQKSKI